MYEPPAAPIERESSFFIKAAETEIPIPGTTNSSINTNTHSNHAYGADDIHKTLRHVQSIADLEELVGETDLLFL